MKNQTIFKLIAWAIIWCLAAIGFYFFAIGFFIE